MKELYLFLDYQLHGIILSFQQSTFDNFINKKIDVQYNGGLDDDRKMAVKGRTKEEELRISQGPFFRMYCRRVAKIYKEDGNLPGQRNHCYYELSQNYDNSSTNFTIDKLSYNDDDSAPTREFLDALNTDIEKLKIESPVKDHKISILLFAGIYESIAKANNNDFNPVEIVFKKGDWQLESK